MNVLVRLEYELAYYDSAVHRFNHYTTRTHQSIIDNSLQKKDLNAWVIDRMV